MELERYLVLTFEEGEAKEADVFRWRGTHPFGLSTATRGAQLASLETAELTPREASAEQRHPRKILQPDLSTRLITPLEPSDSPPDAKAASAEEGGLTWGLEAIGVGETEYDGSGTIVAILDTGIVEHAAFEGLDIVKKDFTGEGIEDLNGHGTHCAGTIAGRPIAGQPRFGVAPGIDQLLVGKVLAAEGGSSQALVQAIQWAMQNGADIISMSLGYDLPGAAAKMIKQGWPAKLATSRVLESFQANVFAFAALANAGFALAGVGAGALIVAAAGNESRRDLKPHFTVGATPPAASPGVISVGALQSKGPPHSGLSVALFSNTGPDISGPGVDVLSTWMDGGTRRISGTSMATPHVAGLAALWHQRNLESVGVSTPETVERLLIGRAQTSRLEEQANLADVGLGLVVAP